MQVVVRLLAPRPTTTRAAHIAAFFAVSSNRFSSSAPQPAAPVPPRSDTSPHE